MTHIFLHFLVPILFAMIFYNNRWRFATWIMFATMLVDVDHLLADPVYDPMRCSINFHPLHSYMAIVIYGLLFLLPIFLKRKKVTKVIQKRLDIVQLLGLGLLIHMALDAFDCWV